MAKKRGQPPKAPEDRHGALIQLRVRADEKQGFEDAARLSGLSLSAWMRERLRGTARTELANAGQAVVFVKLGKIRE